MEANTAKLYSTLQSSTRYKNHYNVTQSTPLHSTQSRTTLVCEPKLGARGGAFSLILGPPQDAYEYTFMFLFMQKLMMHAITLCCQVGDNVAYSEMFSAGFRNCYIIQNKAAPGLSLPLVQIILLNM